MLIDDFLCDFTYKLAVAYFFGSTLYSSRAMAGARTQAALESFEKRRRFGASRMHRPNCCRAIVSKLAAEIRPSFSMTDRRRSPARPGPVRPRPVPVTIAVGYALRAGTARLPAPRSISSHTYRPSELHDNNGFSKLKAGASPLSREWTLDSLRRSVHSVIHSLNSERNVISVV